MPRARSSLGAVGGLDVRDVVAGVGEAQPPRRRLEHRVEAGDEHLLRHVRAQVLVDALEDDARLEQPLRRRAQDAARGGHHERGGDALVGDVADDEGDAPVGQRDDVVEVAADLAGRLVVARRSSQPGRSGSSLRQEVLLDQPRDLELGLEALARRRLGLLLADQLADAQRRRRLRGEVVEQPPVVGRVVLLGQPRAEVERRRSARPG